MGSEMCIRDRATPQHITYVQQPQFEGCRNLKTPASITNCPLSELTKGAKPEEWDKGASKLARVTSLLERTLLIKARAVLLIQMVTLTLNFIYPRKLTKVPLSGSNA